ncbi:DUF5819 family protein [Streptomyces sp. NPDC058045]|uniref:DUF5819 family protein n=1 Tax=Streptomyces sp. NPDC058045 TaxID=3346311 RepID=UPI0036EC5CCD
MMEQFTKTTVDSAPSGKSGVPGESPGVSEESGPAAEHVESSATPEKDAEGSVPPAEGEGRDAGRPVRLTKSLAVLAVAAVVLLGAAVWHIGMVFLTLAPDSSVTQKYQKSINGYIYPEFGQGWQMFAPNPLAQNVAIGARVKTLGSDGTRHTWGWENLSYPHVQAMRHNLVPSHLDQNVLRRSWDFYTQTHNQKEKPTNGMRSELSTEYLTRLALQSFGRRWNGEQIVGIQLASRTVAVSPPKWKGQKAPDTTTYRILPWWPVEAKFYKEL